MSTYDFVLFLHIMFVLLSFGLAAILHLSMFELRAANTGADARPAARRLARLEPLFPLSALGIFLAGGYLVGKGWEWNDAWILGAIAGFLVMEGLGGTLLKKATKRIHDSVESTGPTAPLEGEAAGFRSNFTLWACAHLVTALGIGIVYLMTTKPGTVGTVVTLAVFTLAGILSAFPFVRPARPATAPSA